MSKKTIELYDIEIKLVIRKDYWDEENDTITPEVIRDKIQQGIEVPIESITVNILK